MHLYTSTRVSLFMSLTLLALTKDVSVKFNGLKAPYWLCNLPDLITRDNSFDNLNKSMHFFIKSTADITRNRIRDGLNQLKMEFKMQNEMFTFVFLRTGWITNLTTLVQCTAMSRLGAHGSHRWDRQRPSMESPYSIACLPPALPCSPSRSLLSHRYGFQIFRCYC